jgi:hypothetical protein
MIPIEQSQAPDHAKKMAQRTNSSTHQSPALRLNHHDEAEIGDGLLVRTESQVVSLQHYIFVFAE